MPNATPLAKHHASGKLLSVHNRSGMSECSTAASQWRLKQATPATFATLAKCRKAARQNASARLKQHAGKLAEGRGTFQRSEKAQGLAAAHAAKAAAKAPAAAAATAPAPQAPGFSLRPGGAAAKPTTGSLFGRPATGHAPTRLAAAIAAVGGPAHLERQAAGLPSQAKPAPTDWFQPEAPKPAPPPSAAPAFGLKQESATGRKAAGGFFDAGAGRTGTMFDMKKGDLPGQTSLLEQVPAVDTSPAAAAPTPAPSPGAGPSKREMINRKIDANHEANQAAAKGARSVELTSGETTGVNRMLVHPSTREPGRYQLSRIDHTGQPAGHATFDTKEQAIASASGKAVGNEPPHGHRGFKVTDVAGKAAPAPAGSPAPAPPAAAPDDPMAAELARRAEVMKRPPLERMKASIDPATGNHLVGGDVIRQRLADATPGDLDAIDEWSRGVPLEHRGAVRRWIGGEVAARRREIEAAAGAPAAPSPRDQAAAKRAASGLDPEGRAGLAERRKADRNAIGRGRILAASGEFSHRSPHLGARVGDDVAHLVDRSKHGKVVARDPKNKDLLTVRRPDGLEFKALRHQLGLPKERLAGRYSPERKAQAEAIRAGRRKAPAPAAPAAPTEKPTPAPKAPRVDRLARALGHLNRHRERMAGKAATPGNPLHNRNIEVFGRSRQIGRAETKAREAIRQELTGGATPNEAPATPAGAIAPASGRPGGTDDGRTRTALTTGDIARINAASKAAGGPDPGDARSPVPTNPDRGGPRAPAGARPTPDRVKEAVDRQANASPAPLPLADFARHVVEAARSSPTGKLGRGDLLGSMDPADVRESATPHLNAVYHFVRHPEATAPAPAADAPGSLRKLLLGGPSADRDARRGRGRRAEEARAAAGLPPTQPRDERPFQSQPHTREWFNRRPGT